MGLSDYIIFLVAGVITITLIVLGARYFFKGLRHLRRAELNVTIRELEDYAEGLRKQLRFLAKDHSSHKAYEKIEDESLKSEEKLADDKLEIPHIDMADKAQAEVYDLLNKVISIVWHLYEKGGTEKGRQSEIQQVKATRYLVTAAAYFALASIVIGVTSWLTGWILLSP